MKITNHAAPAQTEAQFEVERLFDEMAKRHSKSQDFRSLGDELSGHEPFMLFAGILAAGKLDPDDERTESPEEGTKPRARSERR